MGLQWCPRDPKVQVNEDILDMYCLIPIKYQNKFESMDFTVYVPNGAKTDVLYTEEDATVTFVEEQGRKRGEIRVMVTVSGIPRNAEKLLRVFAPWDGQFEFAQSSTEEVSVSLQLK